MHSFGYEKERERRRPLLVARHSPSRLTLRHAGRNDRRAIDGLSVEAVLDKYSLLSESQDELRRQEQSDQLLDDRLVAHPYGAATVADLDGLRTMGAFDDQDCIDPIDIDIGSTGGNFSTPNHRAISFLTNLQEHHLPFIGFDAIYYSIKKYYLPL